MGRHHNMFHIFYLVHTKEDLQKIARLCTPPDHIQYTWGIFICWIKISAPGHVIKQFPSVVPVEPRGYCSTGLLLGHEVANGKEQETSPSGLGVLGPRIVHVPIVVF